jgi:hypothetical protein
MEKDATIGATNAAPRLSRISVRRLLSSIPVSALSSFPLSVMAHASLDFEQRSQSAEFALRFKHFFDFCVGFEPLRLRRNTSLKPLKQLFDAGDGAIKFAQRQVKCLCAANGFGDGPDRGGAPGFR